MADRDCLVRQSFALPSLSHMLHEARRRTRAAGLRISYLRAEAQGLPISPAVAAGVTIGGSLNEIGDLDGCLHEVRRVLADDGRYVAMTLTQANTRAGRTLQRLARPFGIHFWTPDTLADCFARHDLLQVGAGQRGIVLFTLCVPVHHS